MRGLFIGLLLAAMGAGCTTTGTDPAARREAEARREAANLSRSEGAYWRKFALSPEANDVIAGKGLAQNAPLDAVMIHLAGQETDPAARRQAVAKATARVMIMKSDALCEQYMAGFMKTARTATSAFKITSLGLSTAAGVTSPVRSANLLSALSAFASGSEEKLNQTVLGEKAPELLYDAVMAVRGRERTRLLTLLGNAELGAEAPGMVSAQLSDYHSRCGPTVGMNSLRNSVQEATRTGPTEGAAQATAFVESLRAP